jgi:uncharacterized protein with GYD domain
VEDPGWATAGPRGRRAITSQAILPPQRTRRLAGLPGPAGPGAPQPTGRWPVSIIVITKETDDADLHLPHQVHPPGHQHHQGGPGRLDANKEVLNRYGSELKAFYLTVGQYDIVTISEAPEDAAAAKVALTVGSVTAETLRAFTADEYREIVAALP